MSWHYHLPNTKGVSWPAARLFIVENMEHPTPPTIGWGRVNWQSHMMEQDKVIKCDSFRVFHNTGKWWYYFLNEKVECNTWFQLLNKMHRNKIQESIQMFASGFIWMKISCWCFSFYNFMYFLNFSNNHFLLGFLKKYSNLHKRLSKWWWALRKLLIKSIMHTSEVSFAFQSSTDFLASSHISPYFIHHSA